MISGAEGRIVTAVLSLTTACAIALFLLIGGPLPKGLAGINLVRHIQALAQTARRVLWRRPTAWQVGMFSVAIHMITVLGVLAVTQALDLAIPFWNLFLVVLPVLLIIMIPVSIAGWGVREGAMIVAFGYVGLPQDQALAVSILLGLVLLGVGALGGLVWVLAGARWLSTDHAVAEG